MQMSMRNPPIFTAQYCLMCINLFQNFDICFRKGRTSHKKHPTSGAVRYRGRNTIRPSLRQSIFGRRKHGARRQRIRNASV